MALIVQKYGGTSVADVDRIKKVAQRVKETYEAGNQVIVVVSARSGVTNELIARAKSININPDEREMDMLLTVGDQTRAERITDTVEFFPTKYAIPTSSTQHHNSTPRQSQYPTTPQPTTSSQ